MVNTFLSSVGTCLSREYFLVCLNFPGTCWGSYVVLRLCSDTHFRAGISLHPSHTPIAAMLLESEEELLKEVKCPQMFMPAGIAKCNNFFRTLKFINK